MRMEEKGMKNNITFKNPDYVKYIQDNGAITKYPIPSSGTADIKKIIEDIRTVDSKAVIYMYRTSDMFAHIVPGDEVMTDAARKVLASEIRRWAAELRTVNYKGGDDKYHLYVGCADGGCIVAPPKKGTAKKETNERIRTAILKWAQSATSPTAVPTAPDDSNDDSKKTPAAPDDSKTKAPNTPKPNVNVTRGVNRFRAACESLGYKPVSWKTGERV